MPQRHKNTDGPRAETPAEKNIPVRLTGARDWMAVLVVTVVVIGGGIWGTTAELPRTVTVGGVITSPQGAIAVQTPVGGQISEVNVRPGDRVERGGRIARVVDADRSSVVRSPAEGRVFSVPVHVGEVVTPGSVVITAERGGEDDRMAAVLFLPTTVSVSPTPGDPVRLTVQSVPVNQYGVLRGRVSSVDPLPSTHQEISEFVGDAELATAIAGTGGGRRVVVELQTSARTPSGYQWSSPSGPPFRIGLRTLVGGDLPQPPVRPIEWVVPE